jgi:hypothetical protein
VSTELLAPPVDEPQRARAQSRRGKWFFAGFAIAVAATVLLGFSRTYYLKELSAAPSLPTLFHIHGALFTAWVLLLIVQAFLIAQSRTAVHRKLGLVGGLLVLPMLVTGLMVAVVAAKGEGPLSAAVARGEFTLALPAIAPLVGMVIPFASVLLFSTFVAVGLVYRRRPDVHKRFMALGAIAMLPPALGRAIATLTGIAHPALFFGATILFIAAIAVHDLRTRGRVHPVTLWGGLLLIASFPLRLALGNSGLWLGFATWITS